MTYPAFFDDAPVIPMRDPLMAFLGSSDDGRVDYTYLDAVKLAGHSCPTVAGTFLMLARGIATLYDGGPGERGAVRVAFAGNRDEGVVGVMANIATLVTGATDEDGFQGIAGDFNRRHLLTFGLEGGGEMALTRTDTGAGVKLTYSAAGVPPAPEMPGLLQLVIAGDATDEEARKFGALWQDRVRRILTEHARDSGLVSVESTS